VGMASRAMVADFAMANTDVYSQVGIRHAPPSAEGRTS
jgi:hypothetical protein